MTTRWIALLAMGAALTGCPFGEITSAPNDPCLTVARAGTLAARGCQIEAAGCPEPPFPWSTKFEVDCAGSSHDLTIRLDKDTTSHCLTKAAYRALCFVDYADGFRKGTGGCPDFPVDGCGKFLR